MSAPIIKFKTGDWGRILIQRVECERETEDSVWLGTRRQAKVSGYECFHDTWELAHAYLMQEAERVVLHAHRSLESANGILDNIKGMKPPAA